MADNTKITWAEVNEAIAANDTERLEDFQARFAKIMRRNAMNHYLKGLAVQSIFAATMGDVLLAFKNDANNPLTHFKNKALLRYALDHGLTIYTDINDIQPGDSIVIADIRKEKKKTITNSNTLRVLEKVAKDWKVSLASYENWPVQFEAHERSETITKKNFVVGVRQAVPPIPKKKQMFYFFKFPE